MVSRRSVIVSGLSAATLGTIGYGLWPRLNLYDDEVDRQRRLLSSDPKLIDFVRMATLAANGHNTQPWKFRLHDTGVSLLPDLTRRTGIVDPDDHHLYVSLGCAAENFAIAAQAHGRTVDLRIENERETSIEFALQPDPASDPVLYQAIPSRQSTRSVFDGQPIAPAEIELLKAAAREEGVSVLIFASALDREAVLEFVVEGNGAQMDDPAFVSELRDWLRFSPEQALATRDGLFSACSGNPVVPAWMGGPLFRAFFKKGSENDKYRDQIRSSSGIAVFVGDRADPEHWIKVGRSFQRFALRATALGIRNAHINQPIEVPAVRLEFANWLAMPDARPDLVVRFGRAPPLPMSIRRPVDAVLI